MFFCVCACLAKRARGLWTSVVGDIRSNVSNNEGSPTGTHSSRTHARGVNVAVRYGVNNHACGVNRVCCGRISQSQRDISFTRSARCCFRRPLEVGGEVTLLVVALLPRGGVLSVLGVLDLLAIVLVVTGSRRFGASHRSHSLPFGVWSRCSSSSKMCHVDFETAYIYFGTAIS